MSLSTKARAIVLAFGFMTAVPLAAQNAGIELLASPEYLRPDPFGGIVVADNVAPDASVATGLVVSALGGVLGIAAGFLVMRDNAETDAAAPSDEQAATV